MEIGLCKPTSSNFQTASWYLIISISRESAGKAFKLKAYLLSLCMYNHLHFWLEIEASNGSDLHNLAWRSELNSGIRSWLLLKVCTYEDIIRIVSLQQRTEVSVATDKLHSSKT